MPIEAAMLKDAKERVDHCPQCANRPFRSFLRGQVQRPRRFLGCLWRRPYCCIICNCCKTVVGYEDPLTSRTQPVWRYRTMWFTLPLGPKL